MVKIVALSDTHGYLPKIPRCDILLLAGDMEPVWNHEVQFQYHWFNYDFINWIDSLDVKYVVWISGNHTLWTEQMPELVQNYILTRSKKEVYYLEDSLIEIDGLKIYGSPWQLRFYDWAFNLDEPELSQKFDKIPKCDILITHSPAFCCGDLVWDVPQNEVFDANKKYNRIHNGCRKINEKCIEHNIKLHICGHYHSGYGRYKIANTISANCSFVNEKYQPAHEIMEFDI